jgi:hypothetical protein
LFEGASSCSIFPDAALAGWWLSVCVDEEQATRDRTEHAATGTAAQCSRVDRFQGRFRAARRAIMANLSVLAVVSRAGSR